MFEDKPTKRGVDSTPPKAEELLINIFKFWRLRHRSAHIPLDNLDAANWWMARQEERETGDTPFPNKDKDGNTAGWTTPYHDRVCYNLRKFLKMTEPQKAFVILHVEEGVPYRGDDFDFYRMTVSETEKMRSDPEYINKGIARMKKVLRGMVS